ncbi:hypothetical protein P872_10785 [Rhodonellum psychrophilum GCM71 = DSM 17998]|uniref:Uncharacterized protein n=2 Tax=Rhodonellum TaxID=336827 RepID=U5BLA1_9BACT|nr:MULTISPECIES: hypothetical protein [Rhodonellum]ERM81270.1 hypothetical protein P872_10785 [Rhodonellum psychrophilum GCM71 = DSM 17998]MDO9552274.1 hypothetical protein [Rhodonellum sp.]SDY55621.1 hypothetical protein SAMN05444412_101524 [Rhodonellum ikkaensis]
MKFPSIFSSASPSRFDIKPRYYDPVREEIEQRTARIKRELQADGKLESDEEMDEAFHSNYGSSIRGAFTQGGPIKGRGSSVMNNTGFMRLLIIVLLIGGGMGYVYYGLQALYILAIGIFVIVLLVAFFRLKKPARR